MPSFSVIIPVKPGGTVSALERLRALAPAAGPFEVLVAEGCCPSRQRNMAAEQASGEILCFLDDDSLVGPDYFDICGRHMEAPSVAVVGGPSLTPAADSRLQQLFGLALSSPFGSGGVRNRYRRAGTLRRTSERELIFCNLVIRRSVFLDAGGLDERLYPNEENLLLDRIQAAGQTLLHDPRLAVERSQRGTLRLFIRQMFSYGRGRARQTLIAGPGPLAGYVPLAFIIYLTLLPFLARVPLLVLPAVAYAGLSCLSAAAAVVTSRRPSALYLAALFPVMHCANGLGLAWGFLGGLRRRTNLPADRDTISIRMIKGLDSAAW